MRIKKSRLFAVIFLHFDFIAVVLIICFYLIHALEMSFFSFYLNFTLQRFRSFHLIAGPVIDCSRCRCICAVLIGAYCDCVVTVTLYISCSVCTYDGDCFAVCICDGSCV